MRAAGFLAASFAFLVAGCTPIIPMHFGETAEVLGKKDVSLTVSGGGGSPSTSGTCCGGGAARVRVGVGHKMEVGAEVDTIGFGNDKGGGINVGGKVSYKYAPIPYVAILAGVGAGGVLGIGPNSTNSDVGIGADAGVVASTDLLAKTLRIFGGFRFSFVVPARRDVFAGSGMVQAFVIPAGLSFEPNRNWRLYLEGGYLGGLVEGTDANGNHPASNWNAGYGAVSLAYYWRSK